MNKPISLKGKAMYYNRPLPLAEHFIPLIGDKKAVKIADIGSGPFPITGQYLEGVKVEMHHCDKNDFKEFWQKYGLTPLYPIEHQYMERLTYPDNSFDIVNCVNALEDGTFVNNSEQFDLKNFGFSIEFIDNHGQRQYNHIIAKHKKTTSDA